MFKFELEIDIPLLTVTRTGFWSLDTVKSYEAALRPQLTKLRLSGRPTAFIIDIRSTGPQALDVAEALRSMVGRLGSLHADRTAVVTSSGIAKLQARRVADANAQVFTSMVLARDWVIANSNPALASETVHSAPSDAEAAGRSVHVHGPSDVDVSFTPAAALETAKRIGDAAFEVLISNGQPVPK
ncbi:MAG: hypothetical protein Q7T68_13105 [Sphingopyxis sp.]|nr:hypothetical protein [Sphingopyxis sp.]